MTVQRGERRARTFLIVAAAAALTFALGSALTIWLIPPLLVGIWLPNATEELQAELLGTTSQSVLFALGGIIALVGVTLSLSRHREELEAAERDARRLQAEAERELRGRFVTAVELLSEERPVKRTAALYALSALADDWLALDRTDEVQSIVDVICGYLRAPLKNGDSATPAEEVDVRATGYRLLFDHLSLHAVRSWQRLHFDLAGAVIDFC